jgi:hypothetical protein
MDSLKRWVELAGRSVAGSWKRSLVEMAAAVVAIGAVVMTFRLLGIRFEGWPSWVAIGIVIVVLSLVWQLTERIDQPTLDGLTTFDRAKMMPKHLKRFFWLVVASSGVDLASTLIAWRPTILTEINQEVIGAIVCVGLAWAAAGYGHRWAAWVLVIVAVLAAVFVAIEFVGPPAWRIGLHDYPRTTFDKASDATSSIMLIAALYFYFAGDKKKRLPVE